MPSLFQDLTWSLRSLTKRPGFSFVAIATLALGIGSNTAIFTLVNAVLIRPLPYTDPDRLVMLWGNVKRTVVERRAASYPDYVDWRDRARSFESMTAVWDLSVTLYGADEPERLRVEAVSASYFPLLGVAPRLGRLFRPEEDLRPRSAPVVVMSEALWKRRFGSDPELIGKTLALDDRSYTVIGVLPAGFRGITEDAELWLPTMEVLDEADLNSRGNRWFPAVARLKPGATVEQAQAELTEIARQLEKAYPETNENRSVEVVLLRDELLGELKPALLALLAAVGFVLLIACANVAHLVLARSQARQREMAVRTALGASRGRLFQQLAIESLTLTSVGGGLGILLSAWAVDALMAASPVRFPAFVVVRIDPTVIGFTLLASVASGVALGLVPALASRVSRVSDALKESSGRGTPGVSHKHSRAALVAAEVALALVLLVGAGLFIRSFRELTAVEPGYRTEGVLTMRVGLPRTREPDARTAAPEILEALRSLPRVQEVSLASDAPLAGSASAIFYTAEGEPPVNAQTMPRAYVHRVTPGFFRALGVRMIRGRDFTEEEIVGRRDVVIVSAGIADRFWRGRDPIGRRIRRGDPRSKAPWLTIVGVVDEVKYRALPRNPTPDPDVYFPFAPNASSFAVVLRTPTEPSRMASAARDAILKVEKSAAVYSVATLRERVNGETARSRFTSWLMGVFALTALLLATVGLYGVMAQVVAERTREIGIRIALGAARSDLLRMIAGRGLALTGLGVVMGLLASLVLSRLVESLLFGVSAVDPPVYVGVSALLLGVAMLASYVPARRAASVDPVTALRYE